MTSARPDRNLAAHTIKLRGARVVPGDDQIAAFDDVISYLIDKVDRRTLAEVSNRLAQLKKAPLNVVATLARHADRAVAGLLLENLPSCPTQY